MIHPGQQYHLYPTWLSNRAWYAVKVASFVLTALALLITKTALPTQLATKVIHVLLPRRPVCHQLPVPEEETLSRAGQSHLTACYDGWLAHGIKLPLIWPHYSLSVCALQVGVALWVRLIC